MASCEIASEPNTMANAARMKTKIPSLKFPFVDFRILSLLKKIPEPITIPVIMAIEVNKPYLCFFIGTFPILYSVLHIVQHE